MIVINIDIKTPNQVACQSPNQILAISVHSIMDSILHIITFFIFSLVYAYALASKLLLTVLRILNSGRTREQSRPCDNGWQCSYKYILI
jgi:hypothetical protein